MWWDFSTFSVASGHRQSCGQSKTQTAGWLSRPNKVYMSYMYVKLPNVAQLNCLFLNKGNVFSRLWNAFSNTYVSHRSYLETICQAELSEEVEFETSITMMTIESFSRLKRPPSQLTFKVFFSGEVGCFRTESAFYPWSAVVSLHFTLSLHFTPGLQSSVCILPSVSILLLVCILPSVSILLLVCILPLVCSRQSAFYPQSAFYS